MLNDPVSDMLTRIRNAQSVRLSNVIVLYSKFCMSILDVLQREGYILGYSVEDDRRFKLLNVKLKYFNNKSVITKIVRASKPGRRLYKQINKLSKYYNGLGISILSTSKGVLSDYEARNSNVGGEVICHVF